MSIDVYYFQRKKGDLMASCDRLSVYERILGSGLVPLFYDENAGTAFEIVASCAKGGARVIELTNRGEKALEVFAAIKSMIRSKNVDMALGIGSIIDPATAALFIAHGADFIVGPLFNKEIALLCNRHKIAYIPGCGTVSEIGEAEETGAEIVKLFPGDSLGPSFIKSVLGPMPWSRLMPTGGVDTTEDSVKTWIKAGAACLGIGSNLIRKELVKAGKFSEISALTEKTLALIKEARAGK